MVSGGPGQDSANINGESISISAQTNRSRNGILLRILSCSVGEVKDSREIDCWSSAVTVERYPAELHQPLWVELGSKLFEGWDGDRVQF